MPSSPARRLVRVRTRLSLRPVLAALTGLLLVLGGTTLARAGEPGTGTGGGGSASPSPTATASSSDSSPTPTSLSSSIATTTSISCVKATYTGFPLTPCTATTTAADGTVVAHPSVTYTNNVNATSGSDPRRWATASASYFDPNGLYGESRAEEYFQIGKRPLQVGIGCPTVVAYTGSAVEPCIAFVDGQSATGSIVYRDNVGPGTATATLLVNGDANTYGGGASAQFRIGYPTTVTVTCTGATYTGAPLTPCTARATSAYDPEFSLDLTSSITYTGNTDAGTATASVAYAGDGSGGHLPSSGSATFVIAKAPVTVTVTCPASALYTGAALTPCSATTTGAGTLTGTTTVTYRDNVYAGTATATGSYSGDANHLAGTGTATFQVKGFTLTGYSSPLAMGSGGTIVWNTAKAGSTIPLRFSAYLPGGSPVPTTAVLGATLTVTPVSCTTGAATGPATSGATVGAGAAGSLYYGGDGDFGLNWKTPKTPGCYQVTTTTADHSTLSAYVVLR